MKNKLKILTITFFAIHNTYAEGGVGTRGTNNAFNSQLENTVTYAKHRLPQTLSNVFQSDSKFLVDLFIAYVVQKQKTFERNPHFKNLTYSTPANWAAENANNVLDLLYKTRWEIIRTSDFNTRQFEYASRDGNVIEVEASDRSLEAPLTARNVADALTFFLMEAGAPYSKVEINAELIPFVQMFISEK